jgi:hypothetical protein
MPPFTPSHHRVALTAGGMTRARGVVKVVHQAERKDAMQQDIVSRNDKEEVWVATPTGDLLAECSFKAPEELEHMGYPQLLHMYPPEEILCRPGDCGGGGQGDFCGGVSPTQSLRMSDWRRAVRDVRPARLRGLAAARARGSTGAHPRSRSSATRILAMGAGACRGASALVCLDNIHGDILIQLSQCACEVAVVQSSDH